MRHAVRLGLVSIACWIASGAEALACPVCFQVEAGPVTEGVQAAVWVLVAVTSAVLTGFAVFAGRIARRAAHLDETARERRQP